MPNWLKIALPSVSFLLLVFFVIDPVRTATFVFAFVAVVILISTVCADLLKDKYREILKRHVE
jgi:hypothetical protein